MISENISLIASFHERLAVAKMNTKICTVTIPIFNRKIVKE
jgi:hypothetical protein